MPAQALGLCAGSGDLGDSCCQVVDVAYCPLDFVAPSLGGQRCSSGV